MRNVIVCNLSLLTERKFASTNGRAQLDTYSAPSGLKNVRGTVYTGFQTNEAPVKCLFSNIVRAGNTVDAIICLHTKECLNKTVPFEKLPKEYESAATAMGFYEGEKLSTVEYFKIAMECNPDGAIPDGLIETVQYEKEDIVSGLQGLLEIIGASPTQIHIDFTGGTREATILMTLAIELEKMRESQDTRGSNIGNIVYADYDSKEIKNQTRTFDIVDLINAVNAFTEYGRADQLVAFFGKENSYVKKPTLELCRALERFSDDLMICNVNNIDKRVKDVVNNLNDCEAKLEKIMRIHSLAEKSSAELAENTNTSLPEIAPQMEQIKDELRDESSNNLIPEAVLEKVFHAESIEDYQPAIELLKKETQIVRAELLFKDLIPTIREAFVRYEKPEDWFTETVMWCVNHQMIQQALCIYKEHVSEYLIAKGLITITEEGKERLKRISDPRGKRERTDVTKVLRPGVAGYSFTEYRANGENEPYIQYLASPDESKARCILTWSACLLALRNRVMHSGDNADTLKVKRAEKAFEAVFSNIGNPYSMRGIKQIIKSAITAIDGGSLLTESQWKTALEKTDFEGIYAKGTVKKVSDNNKPNKKRFPFSVQIEVSDIDELIETSYNKKYIPGDAVILKIGSRKKRFGLIQNY